jgi:hypothetical protein
LRQLGGGRIRPIIEIPIEIPTHHDDTVADHHGFTGPSVQGVGPIAVAFILVVGLELAAACESTAARVADELRFEMTAQHSDRLGINLNGDLLNRALRRLVSDSSTAAGPGHQS